LALRAELGDHVGAFVDGPDVVVLVDADRVGEFEAVVALPDLSEEGAVLVELEQARRIAPMEDEDVTLRVRGDGHRLAKRFPGRQLEEVRDRRERDVRYARDRRLRLRECLTCGKRQNGARESQNTCHRTPLACAEPIPASPVVQSVSMTSRAWPQSTS